MASRVVTQHAKSGEQRRHLRVPHAEREPEAVRQHEHGRARRAVERVMDPGAVDEGGGHRSVPQYIAMPPFTSTVEPVMYDASSEARNATTVATSRGNP